MKLQPIHVLVGESNARAALVEAQQSPTHSCEWIVPKSALKGETVLMLSGKEFIGVAVIQEDAKTLDKTGKYQSLIGFIQLWSSGIATDEIAAELPNWKYLSYTRSYVSIPPEVREPLRDAIYRALVARENRNLSNDFSDVLSIPTGTSIDISEDTYVYACPDYYSYRDTKYLTLRHANGIMKQLYQVQWKGVLPELEGDLELVPKNYQARVRDYIERRTKEWHFGDCNFRFYVLSRENNIQLPHHPRFKNRGHVYIRLRDLVSGEKFVQVSSKYQGQASESLRLKPFAEVLREVEKQQMYQQSADSSNDFYTDDFDPETLNEAREYQARQIVARRGQGQFRQQLLEAYGEKCAFSSYSPKEALEAAHIIPYCGAETNHVTNGLLLRADIHTLFDQNLISIDTSNLTNWVVIMSPTLAGSSYGYLNGKPVRLPENTRLRPNIKAVQWHREQLKI